MGILPNDDPTPNAAVVTKELAYDAAAYLADEAAPYLSSARASLRVVWTDKIPAPCGVDMFWRLYLHPEKFTAHPVQQRGYLILHEVAHVLRKHFERCKAISAEPFRWNLAADAEINSNKWEAEGLEFPPGGFEASRLGMPDGKLAEDYLPAANEKVITIKIPFPGGGSGADGDSRPWELPANSDEAPGVRGAEADAIRQIVAEAIKKHQADGRGDVPGGWAVWADAVLKPVVPWQQILRSAIAHGTHTIGMGSRSYTRAREKWGVCLPRHIHRTPTIALVPDTSGSMRDGEGSQLQRCISEVLGVTKQAGTATVVWCDAAATVQRNVRRAGQFKPIGGGGTDMGVGIRTADALKGADKPDLIVTITDGDTPWPKEPPSVPHITVLVADDTTKGPGWGKVIHVPIASR